MGIDHILLCCRYVKNSENQKIEFGHAHATINKSIPRVALSEFYGPFLYKTFNA